MYLLVQHLKINFFRESFTPSATVAAYDAYYITKSAGETPNRDDTASFFFFVTDKTFGSLLPESQVTPANYMEDIAAIWNVSATITKFYSGGNIYYVPKGNNYVVDTVRFGLANVPGEISGTGSVIVDLYEWDDKNSDGSCIRTKENW